MLDLIAENGFADTFGIFLILELRRMDADDDQFVGVFLFEIGQLRQGVHAVNAAERPEIEEDDLAAQVLQMDRAGGVQPGHAAIQFRCETTEFRGLCGLPLSLRAA